MNAQINETTVAIACTLDELYTMQGSGLAIYGTPNACEETEPIAQVYMGRRPQWHYDRILATVYNFLAAMGFDSLGEYDEQTAEELAEEYELTVPRMLPTATSDET
jgi:hypothetical protein